TGPAVRLWDVTTGEEINLPEGAHKGCVGSVCFSADGRTLATTAGLGEGDDAVRLWDTASGKPLRVLQHPGASAGVFAPDGKRLASGGTDGVYIWDVSTGKQRRKLEVLGGYQLAFSSDGKLLATGGDNPRADPNVTLLWDLATGTKPLTLDTKLPRRESLFTT